MEESEKNTDSKKSELSMKICGVCGDRALGYNFKAISCESCKAFFRRNALLSKEFKCPFEERCHITVLTRRFCQKCRLDKCFAIGMSKECIMSEEDRNYKRQKIEENRAKRKNNSRQDDETAGSKMIKLEDDESADNRQIPFNNGEHRSHCEPIHNGKANCFENVNHNNQATVSVIKNNGTIDPETICEQTVYNLPKKVSSIPVEYGTNSETVPSVPFQSHGTLPYDHITANQSVYHDKEHENAMIRSMLTTSPPTEDSSRLFSQNSNQSHQQACDNSYESENRDSRQRMDVARDVLQEVEKIQVESKSMKLILCEAIKLEFETYTSLAQINNSSRELNDAERARLNELIVANKALLAPLDDYMTTLVNDENRFKPSQGQNDPMLLSIINLTAVAIKRLIKMAKKINAFKNMCEEDQIALLKGGCTEMMILRSTMTYDCARNTWKVPHSQESLSSIKAEVLKLAKGNIYQEHDRFVRTFDAKWRTDENIILIMSAIVLFTPNRPKVVHSDVIKLEQNSYYYLLRRYLESVYPGCEAKSTFLKLIQKIMELQKLAEEVIGVYLDVNPIYVEPLLIEIFDLKQPH